MENSLYLKGNHLVVFVVTIVKTGRRTMKHITGTENERVLILNGIKTERKAKDTIKMEKKMEFGLNGIKMGKSSLENFTKMES